MFEPLSYSKNSKNPLASSFNNPLSPFSNPNFFEHYRTSQNDSKQPIKEESQTIGEDREKVAYSNWYAGNVDPEELHKHKELMDRQYFGGPVWDGIEKPVSIMNDQQ